MKTEESQSGLGDVEELLEELPETFTSSKAAERTEASSKKLSRRLTQYADQTESDLNRIHGSPACFSRHNLNLSHTFVKRGLDILKKSVQTVWENGSMTEQEIDQMKSYTEAEELYTQLEIVGELKDILDEQYPGIEYNREKQEFYRVE